MLKDKLKFKLQKTAIILICIALLAFLMQGASYFSRANQHARITQFEELAKTLAEQVAFSLSNYMDDSSKDNVNPLIMANLNHLTHDSRVLDASLYLEDGTQIAHSGENVTVKERLALTGQKSGGSFNHQLVVPVPGKDKPKGFLRLTLDTHQLVTESSQVDNTTNLLRVMLLVALAIGFLLSHNLLQLTPVHWQQSPYLLTANLPSRTEKENENSNENNESDHDNKEREQPKDQEETESTQERK